MPARNRQLFAWTVFPLVMFGALGQVWGQSVTFKPMADTTLFQNFPGNNLGGHTDFVSGSIATGPRSRGLLKFDVVGMVPAGSLITSASLTVNVVKVPGASVSSTYDLRQVLVDWGEGARVGKTGSAATANEASWNNRRTSLAAWAVAGGGIGSDFASTVSASRFIAGAGSYTFSSTAGLVADVQTWLDSPSANFGWVLMSQSESTSRTAHRFGSREHPASSPMLTIQYTVVPEPGTASLLVLGGAFAWWFRRKIRPEF